jgi:hypothetical protein
MILAIDPGDTTGWASLSMEGVLVDMGQATLAKLYPWLENLTDEFKVIVLENFKVRPGHNFAWSEMNTIQVIGAIKYRAHQLGIPIVLQEPSSYSIGAKWAGVQIPKNHDISHQVVAYAHGTFYSHKKLGNVIPVARRKQNGKA